MISAKKKTTKTGPEIATSEAIHELISKVRDLDENAQESELRAHSAHRIRDNNESSLLHILSADMDKKNAAANARLTAVLIRMGLSVDTIDSKGLTALHRAGEYGNAAQARALLQAGAVVDRANPNGVTALMHSAFGHCLETMEVLAVAGADIHAKSKNKRALVHFAISDSGADETDAKRGALVTTERLIAWGCDINAYDSSHRSALHLAVRGNCAGALEALLRAGANVNAIDATQRTPLHYAAKDSKIELALLLLTHGSDTSLVDLTGKTARSEAEGSGYHEWISSVDAWMDAKKAGEAIEKMLALAEEKKASKLSKVAPL